MRELEQVPKSALKKSAPKKGSQGPHPQERAAGTRGARSYRPHRDHGSGTPDDPGAWPFTLLYAKYSKLIDEKLRAGPFANTAKIFAAPTSIAIGDATTPDEIAAELRRSGYTESRANPMGYYQVHPNSIEIFPGQDSYFDQEAGVIKFSGGKISQIISLQDNTARSLYQLEPQLITNVSGPTREKRRFVKFHDIPRVLVDALTSAEDKRFFSHGGLTPYAW